VLPGGLRLERRRIRGVESAGMILSPRELGLGDEHESILVLPEHARVGAPVAEWLGTGAVVEINNTAITARPDLWGHYGVARELAAILERELRPLDLGAELPEGEPGVAVAVRDRKLCPRYLGWAIGGIRVGPSPAWLRRRLEAVGQRSIDAVVDATNYVMLELGQPLHAFDRRRIARGRIVVRRARRGERVVTLDGIERELPEGACVIADPERALAVAGVMGLRDSEVREDTTEIVLEAATFDRTATRRTAKALGLRTESAVRFEKGPDPEGLLAAARRFLAVLGKVCPGARPLGPPVVAGAAPPRRRPITFPAPFIEARLGTTIPAPAQDAILARLGFRVERTRARVKVTPPSWRASDVTIPEDVVEEVGRIHGYARIEPAPMRGTLDPVPVEPERAFRAALRDALSGAAGLVEIYAYPFVTRADCARARVAEPDLGVRDAAQTGLDFLAPSLLPALLGALARNLKHRDAAALYLVAPVFRRRDGPGLPHERETLGIAIARSGDDVAVRMLAGVVGTLIEALDLADCRIAQEDGSGWAHPGRFARLVRGSEPIGAFGEVAPAVLRAWEVPARAAVAELDVAALRAAAGGARKMRPIGRFPVVRFDVAVVVDRRTPAAEVADTIRRAAPDSVWGVDVFDVYEGPNLPPGKRSLAFTVVFGSLERTLATPEVESLRAAVTGALRRSGYAIRA
jgi:phenylalanyl-tRNA synthetase beta chain